ncbi:hypothetical protein GCM10029976_036800 [Kribbella albertanoniae]|uniref:Uncharacterized protein n=1 Tax=Kribbella albertanoniae TaxID=1266829 RepID=A0A4V2XML1_9ACTN|nr:hypothetical protein [Kribbella albertanoniae]TDC14656.1 hypothetical protein E1261_41850 [Kribbella albertanoniae]
MHGRKLRREEQRVAAGLVYQAVIEIRGEAAARLRSKEPDVERIRRLADVVHNLPGLLGGGRIGARSGPPGWPGPGTFTFYWLWTTASPAQKAWLIEQFKDLGFDYTYLKTYGEWPVRAEPPTSLSLRRGGWRRPYDASSVRVVSTATLARLMTEAFDRDLTSKSYESSIAHLKPDATHVLLPRHPGDNFFSARRDGVWEYRVLQRMSDDALIDCHLIAFRSSIAALPVDISRIEQLRLAALPESNARDTGLWFRDHRVAQPDCPECSPDLFASISLEDL